MGYKREGLIAFHVLMPSSRSGSGSFPDSCLCPPPLLEANMHWPLSWQFSWLCPPNTHTQEGPRVACGPGRGHSVSARAAWRCLLGPRLPLPARLPPAWGPSPL